MQGHGNHKPEMVYFKTFEAREAAFNDAVGSLIPVKYRGPQRFWRDFRELTAGGHPLPGRLPAYITSNPRDCLAFGSPFQVLSAARMAARGHGGGELPSIEEIAHTFELSQALRQPIRTLSGGETIRLALAKTWAAAAHRERLVIASPFCWMSRNNAPMLDRVLDRYFKSGKPVSVLAMADEDNNAPIAPDRFDGVDVKGPVFDLRLRNLRIGLGAPINALTAEPVFACVSDFCAQLRSPCLVTGDNGQGKSLLAKAVSGALTCTGTIAIASSAGGPARLLFQDVISQTLLRNLNDMARSVQASAWRDCGRIKKAISSRYNRLLGRFGADGGEPGQSLLAVKAMLIAVRLSQRPALLFLDEPDWGLSRTDAIAFVLAVLDVCHNMQVPVVIISHKPWWQPLAGSVLEVCKEAREIQDCLFHIVLKRCDPMQDLKVQDSPAAGGSVIGKSL